MIGRKLDVNGYKRMDFNGSKVECYNYHKNGHFARECRLPRNQEKRGKENNRRTVTVETPTENALVAQDGIGGSFLFSESEEHSFPSKPDITFIMYEIVKSENIDVTIVVTPSNVKKVESNHEFADVKSNPQQKEYKEKGVIDSGCSRHMTRNKCYLTEYEDYDGGFVSFGDGKGQISGKVLLTDTECLVLSSDFKQLDESQVLLRVPRKDNIYSVDLKSVVPTRGLTCPFANAIIDESNLWHRRLGHTNFKNMNKLVRGNLVRGLPSKIFENDHSCVACQKGKQHKASYKAKLVNSISKPLYVLHMDLFGPINVKSLMKKSYCPVVTDDFKIENQLDHKVKVIRCDNGTGFKNSIMNQFYEIKGIKREFSVARTPQQNGVDEKKNRTLIEAVRTMDHQEKFDGKADEVEICWVQTEEMYHTLSLFDVDSMSKSMNYAPVVAGNQTNGIVGKRDNIVAGQAEKNKEPEQEYILIPICTTDPLISQDPKVCEEDAEEM
ncbi:putative ribonuclease H-like domain-containing protein [Tanacetum coccineum]|uniref:Ribonuclease H-like domain-containing protein n=1 Tax=Tanacetum coccineum TaxID=301880 RepID=A0ABQ5DXE5_9ASTR